jgi:hypothetical protein
VPSPIDYKKLPPQSRICSVWDWNRLMYGYYVAPGSRSIGGWKPMSGMGTERRNGGPNRPGVGIDIEDALSVLPRSAKRLQRRGVPVWGREAVGQVCVLPKGSGGVGDLDQLQKEAVSAVTGRVRKFATRKRGMELIGAFMFGLSVGAVVPKAKRILTAGSLLSLLAMGYKAGGVDKAKELISGS